MRHINRPIKTHTAEGELDCSFKAGVGEQGLKVYGKNRRMTGRRVCAPPLSSAGGVTEGGDGAAPVRFYEHLAL